MAFNCYACHCRWFSLCSWSSWRSENYARISRWKTVSKHPLNIHPVCITTRWWQEKYRIEHAWAGVKMSETLKSKSMQELGVKTQKRTWLQRVGFTHGQIAGALKMSVCPFREYSKLDPEVERSLHEERSAITWGVKRENEMFGRWTFRSLAVCRFCGDRTFPRQKYVRGHCNGRGQVVKTRCWKPIRTTARDVHKTWSW